MNKLQHILLQTILLLFLLGTSIFLSAQNGENPFELPNRPVETPTPSTPITEPSAPSTNPFDLNTSANPEQTPTPPVETNAVEEPTPTTPIQNRENTTPEDNPFEINRISINKQPAQEASPSPVLQPQKNKTSNNNNNFLSTVSLFLLILLALLVTLYNSVIGQVYKAFLNDNMLKLKHREQGSFLHTSLIFLYFSFFLNAGFFVYLFAKNTGWEGNNNWQFLAYCILGIAGIFLIKHVVLQVLSNVFPIQKELRQYNFTIVIFNIILGILLVPFNLLIAFGPSSTPKYLIYSFLAIATFVYIFRVIRSLLIGSRYISFHKFHFFMYLCTVEIAPTLVLVKLLLSIQG